MTSRQNQCHKQLGRERSETHQLMARLGAMDIGGKEDDQARQMRATRLDKWRQKRPSVHNRLRFNFKKKRTKCKIQQTTSTVISFNSRGSKGHSQYRLLSNFFGGVECCFMADRFHNKAVANTIRSFANVDEERFRELFKKLFPKGTPESWIIRTPEVLAQFPPGTPSVPVTGILAKLVGGLHKLKEGGKKPAKMWRDRGQALALLADVSYTEVKDMKGVLEWDEKSDLMLKCLREKYKTEPYHTLLLSTGDAALHESPGRSQNDWTFPGRDLLGQLLMKVRSELRSELV